ncbi:MAG: ribosome silencing factor [Spirosomaceae bacterium]|nr:ribosome silencing factor [Spirosomataceae bacterium]MDP5139369.1 ribosome silencing factor [Spirosomataceae bacterium]
MKEKKVDLSSEDLSNLVIKGMLEKKAANIILLDLRKINNTITDFFVICSGSSDTQIDAIATSIDEEVYKASGNSPWHKEGLQNKEWILLDFVNVVAHVFNSEKRAFFDIESLWGDAETTVIDESYAAA